MAKVENGQYVIDVKQTTTDALSKCHIEIYVNENGMIEQQLIVHAIRCQSETAAQTVPSYHHWPQLLPSLRCGVDYQ